MASPRRATIHTISSGGVGTDGYDLSRCHFLHLPPRFYFPYTLIASSNAFATLTHFSSPYLPPTICTVSGIPPINSGSYCSLLNRSLSFRG